MLRSESACEVDLFRSQHFLLRFNGRFQGEVMRDPREEGAGVASHHDSLLFESWLLLLLFSGFFWIITSDDVMRIIASDIITFTVFKYLDIVGRGGRLTVTGAAL